MKYYFISILLIITGSDTCFSQWSQTNGPYGKTRVIEIVPNDSLILVSTSCGYFSKKLISDEWILNSSLNFTGYTQIGDTLFVGGSETKLIDLSNHYLPLVNVNAISLTTLAHSDSCIYGGNSTQGFFKSNNSGSTWVSKNDGLPVDSFFTPQGIYYYRRSVFCIELMTNYIYCGTNKGVYRNNGSLGTWFPVNSGLPIDSVTFIKAYDDTLFTAVGNNLYQSNDFGINWSLLYSGSSKLTSLLIVDSQFYLGTISEGIYYSSNHGSSWNTFNTGLTELNITTISNFDSTLVCGTNSKGIFFYIGNQWQLNNDGIICSSIYSLACTDSFIFSSTWDEVYISELNNWRIISPNLAHRFWATIQTIKDTVVLSVENNTASWPYDIPYIVFTTNNGITWDSLINQPPFAGDDPYRIYTFNSRIYAFEDDRMTYTDNLGSIWTDISLTTPFCNSFRDFAVYGSSPFATACGNQQFLKLNTNSNWILSNNGLPNDRDPNRIAVCDGALFTDVTVHGMYASLDSGITWQYANNGLITINGIRGSVNYNSNLFVTSENGVFVTSDFGQNWLPINDGLKNLRTTSIKILNDTLYVGTEGNGVWKRSIENVHIGINKVLFPSGSIKIFPNPFSREAILRSEFTFKNASISIYNSLGQAVKQLTNISGQTVILSRDNLPNGVYFLQVKDCNKVFDCKLVITD